MLIIRAIYRDKINIATHHHANQTGNCSSTTVTMLLMLNKCHRLYGVPNCQTDLPWRLPLLGSGHQHWSPAWSTERCTNLPHSPVALVLLAGRLDGWQAGWRRYSCYWSHIAACSLHRLTMQSVSCGQCNGHTIFVRPSVRDSRVCQSSLPGP